MRTRTSLRSAQSFHSVYFSLIYRIFMYETSGCHLFGRPQKHESAGEYVQFGFGMFLRSWLKSLPWVHSFECVMEVITGFWTSLSRFLGDLPFMSFGSSQSRFKPPPFQVICSWLPGGHKEMSSILADLKRPRIWAEIRGRVGCRVSANEYITTVHMEPK